MLSWGPWKKKSTRPLAGRTVGSKTKSKGKVSAYSGCAGKGQTSAEGLTTLSEERSSESEGDKQLNRHGTESHSTACAVRGTSLGWRHSATCDQHMYSLHRQPTSSSSLIESRFTIDDGFSNHRPRVWSSLSDTSPPSSYQTPCGSLSTLTTGFSSELLQSMKGLLDDRMSQLEEKMEIGHRQLEAKVNDIEQRLQTHIDSMPLPVVSQCTNGVEVHVQAELFDVKEASEEGDDDSKSEVQSSSQQSPEWEQRVKIKRVYTDSEAMKRAQYKRQEYAKRKFFSLQDSQQLLPKSCNQQVIVWLTQRLTNWKFIARWLGLSETAVTRIETDNPLSDREQCYQMFRKWGESDPDNYTYPVLGQALRKESLELYNEYVKEVHRVEKN